MIGEFVVLLLTGVLSRSLIQQSFHKNFNNYLKRKITFFLGSNPIDKMGRWLSFDSKLHMPVISIFYGLIVSMYYLDSKRHHIPHIHVNFGELECRFKRVAC
jgi:hypothetical protein